MQYSVPFPRKLKTMETSGLLSRGPLTEATPWDVELENKRLGLTNNSLVAVVRYNKRDTSLEQGQEENVIPENLFSHKVLADLLS